MTTWPLSNKHPLERGSRRDKVLDERTRTPIGLAVLLALAIGIPLAFFLSNGSWLAVAVLLFSVPALILFTRYPFSALLVWMIANAFLQTTPTDATRTVFWMVHRALPPLGLMLVVLADMLQIPSYRPRVRLGLGDAAAGAFLLLSLLNIVLFQSSPLEYLYMLYDRVFIPICLYWFVRLVAPRQADLERMMPIALFLVLFESSVGIVSWLDPSQLPEDWVSYSSERAIGTLAGAHAYSTTLVFFSLLLFHFGMTNKTGLRRGIYVLAACMGAAGVFFSFSRGSWLGAMAASLGMLILYPKAVIRTGLVVLIAAILLGGTFFAKQFSFALERINSEETASIRWVIWDAGAQMIEREPLYGWGYGNYNSIAWQFQRRVGNIVAVNGEASHNSYIAIAAELGIPGLILFAFPVLWWLVRTKGGAHLPSKGFWSQTLLAILWLVILDHIVVNFFSDMRHSTYGMGMWWITLGLIGNLVEAHLDADSVKLPAWLRHAAQA